MVVQTVRKDVETTLAELAENDPKSTVKGNAIALLSTYKNPKYKSLFEKGVNDSSYSVSGAALEALYQEDPQAGLEAAKKLGAATAKGKLVESITRILISSGDEGGYDVIAKVFDGMPPSQAKFNLLQPLTEILANIKDSDKVKKGVDMVVKFREAIPEEYGISPFINNLLQNIINKKQTALQTTLVKGPLQEQIEYVQSKISSKKGF